MKRIRVLFHTKIVNIDGEIVITGDFSSTRAAEERNAENLLVIRDKALAAKYIENWKVHDGHPEIYRGTK